MHSGCLHRCICVYDCVIYYIYRLCRCARLQIIIFTPDVDEFGDDDEWNNLACNLDVDKEMLLARSKQSSLPYSKQVYDLTTRIHHLEEQVYNVCARYCLHNCQTHTNCIQIICMYVRVIAELSNPLASHSYPLDIPLPVTHLHLHTLALRHECMQHAVPSKRIHACTYTEGPGACSLGILG